MITVSEQQRLWPSAFDTRIRFRKCQDQGTRGQVLTWSSAQANPGTKQEDTQRPCPWPSPAHRMGQFQGHIDLFTGVQWPGIRQRLAGNPKGSTSFPIGHISSTLTVKGQRDLGAVGALSTKKMGCGMGSKVHWERSSRYKKACSAQSTSQSQY